MSIASEISRIQQNVSDSLAAVADKGVTVPSGSNSDDLAGLIALIPSGGGMSVVETPDSHGGTIVEITGEEVKLQGKTVNPNQSPITVRPDSGYTGLSYVTINAMPSGSVTAPSTISGSSATVSTGTNTLTLSKTVSVTPSVTTAGYVSSGTAGNSSVSLTASVTTKGAATITPTTSQQTIASGTYLTGTQTIAAIPSQYKDVSGVTATAGDVVSGKSFVNSTGTVNGSLVIQTYYTGSSAPSSSLGINGDIYLQTS